MISALGARNQLERLRVAMPLAALTWAGLALAGCGTPPQAAVPPAALQKRIQAELLSSMHRWHEPGASVAVVLPDMRVITAVAGVDKLATRSAVTPATAFAAASITKTFVAALILRLQDQGRLTVHQPIDEWLPDVPDGSAITVRDLLAHTSGLEWDHISARSWLHEVIERPGVAVGAKDNPLHRSPHVVAKPGSVWAYNNGNYELLGRIAERVSGKSLASAIREQFLTPLHLDRTAVQPEDRPEPPIAHGYRWPNADSGYLDVTAGGDGYLPSLSIASFLPAAGGVASTPSDLARWGMALWSGQVLSRSSTSQMLSVSAASVSPRHLPDMDGYGLGVVRSHPGGRLMWNHGGGLSGYQSLVAYLPSVHTAFAVEVNTSRNSLIVGELARAVLQLLGVPARGPIIT